MALPTASQPVDILVTWDEARSGESLRGYAAFPAEVSRSTPVVLVFPNYCGCKELERRMAAWWCEAAGCIGLACDYYTASELPHEVRTWSDPKCTVSPDEHRRLSFGAMNSCLLSKARTRLRPIVNSWFQAGLRLGLDADDAAATRPVLATGYCLGGVAGLELFRSGASPLSGVVSVHGVLETKPTGPDMPREEVPAPAYPAGCRLLVEHGAKDPLAPPDMLERFKAEMASQDLTLHVYDEAAHGFAIPAEFGQGHLPSADVASANAMLSFYRELFPDVAGPVKSLEAVGRTPGGTPLA